MTKRQKVERRPWVGGNFKKFYGQCIRKKKLSEEIAGKIVDESVARGEELYKYKCNHCLRWHITRMVPEIYKKLA